MVYYNEIDKNACAWLQTLISRGLIAYGVVDDRSIADVQSQDLKGFDQCHFFAGIGVWSYALRQSGWEDDRPVWSGSCPCQPFSSAGKKKGFDDERHLWPEFYRLIRECRPPTAIGEQVAGKAGEMWLDTVLTDLERESYACGAAVTAACGFGAPHQRKRLYWVADAQCDEEYSKQYPCDKDETERGTDVYGGCCAAGDVPNTAHSGLQRGLRGRTNQERKDQQGYAGCGSTAGGVGNTKYHGLFASKVKGGNDKDASDNAEKPNISMQFKGTSIPRDDSGSDGGSGQVYSKVYPGPVNGVWRDVDWLLCRDGKWRPVESRSEPMADGIAALLGYSRIGDRFSLNPLIARDKAEKRTIRLKAYGNAIVAQQAQAFIEAYMSIRKK